MPSVALSVVSPTSTVTVLASEKVLPSVAAVTVTVVAPAPSPTLDGFAVRVIAVLSSSVMVTVVLPTEVLGVLPDNVRVSSASTNLSSVGVRVKVPVAELLSFGMVIVKVSTGVVVGSRNGAVARLSDRDVHRHVKRRLGGAGQRRGHRHGGGAGVLRHARRTRGEAHTDVGVLDDQGARVYVYWLGINCVRGCAGCADYDLLIALHQIVGFCSDGQVERMACIACGEPNYRQIALCTWPEEVPGNGFIQEVIVIPVRGCLPPVGSRDGSPPCGQRLRRHRCQ